VRSPFANARPVDLPVQNSAARLSLVIDTEEEFDWSAPFSRANTRVSAMRHIGRAQALAEPYGLRPTYVIDYPVATQRLGYEELRESAANGRCVIGAHLHPWVTPPFEEGVSNANSFTCNLPPALQHAKIRELTTAIEANLGVKPRTFKAGRYGIGADTLDLLETLDYDADVSVNPCMNFRAIQGPDFTAFDSRPFWFGQHSRMLEVPCTHGYIGWARTAGGPFRRFAEARVGELLRLPGILARSGVVNRVMLSPEGNSLAEMVSLTRTLLADGLRMFSLTFHSPSLEPGHTPYVRSRGELDDFLKRIQGYLEFFLGEVNGLPSTPEDFRRELLGAERPHS
jgi:hypothetical protein